MSAHSSSIFRTLLIALLPLISSLLFGSFYVYHQEVAEEAVSTNSVSLNGYRIFLKRCRGCHHSDERKSRGPTRAEITANSFKRKPELSEEQYLLESIMEPGKFRVPGYAERMPDNIADGLTEEDIRSLIYFLMEGSGRLDEKKIAELKITPREIDSSQNEIASYSQIARGRQIFEQKTACVKCHLLSPDVGFDLIAPSILGVGILGEKDLREAIFEPSKRITKGYEFASVLMPDGKIRKGRVMQRTDASITILEVDDQKVIPATIDLTVEEDGEYPEVKLSEVSSMPGNYGELLTLEEQDDLLAFLRTLKTPE